MTSTEPPAPAPRRLGWGAAIVVVLVALAVTVGIGILRAANTPVEEVVARDSPSVDIDAAPLYVHVSGAVRAPGLYVLRQDARVVDAIAAAGGFAEGADEDAVNLARAVSDGEQVVVPMVGAAVAPDAVGTAAGDGRINLNTATEAELDTLPRIGPALAARIAQWREDNGRFTSVEDLLAVPGIGDKMLDALRELVSV